METSTHGGYRLRESTEGSTHEGSTKKQPCLFHHGLRPRRTSLTRGRSSRSRRSPCPYKLLGSTPHLKTEATKRHLTNLGGTTLQKVIDVVDGDELLALVLQMIISPTLNSPH